ncbi:protein kinase [Streptomyces sp. NPDC018347]|uniref:protein kinase domain-containing protein n=1 Tax=Streptomyces sp. NPDC018347 TaxID=3157193 RepID=UPI0033EB402C
MELCGPLPEASVRALGAALCGALGQLHASEVVHRDLKPSDILVTAYGPKAIDFGIARAAGDDRLTRIGIAVGTPAFMSPEQASGQEPSAAGDVLGAGRSARLRRHRAPAVRTRAGGGPALPGAVRRARPERRAPEPGPGARALPGLTDRDDTTAFSAAGNRVFVAGATSVRALPVF